MVECGICFAEYQEGEFEAHRKQCAVLLMFRCTLCNVDFMSKEALLNHLDFHEVADESKELHYQELKAKHKLHQCVLCNDQRAYSESLYWYHINAVHDGFFLRCSDCGEHFRSELHKNDHASRHCKARNKMVAAKYGDLELNVQLPDKTANEASDRNEEMLKSYTQDSSLNSSASSKMGHPAAENLIDDGKRRSRRICNLNTVNYTEDSAIKKDIAVKNVKRLAKSSSTRAQETKCQHCDKEFDAPYLLRFHIRACHKPIVCSVCGMTNYGADRARYHKVINHTDKSFECSKCKKKFHFKKHHTRHLYTCDPLTVPQADLSPATVNLIKGKVKQSLLVHKPSSAEKVDSENPSSEEAECSHCGIKEFNAVNLVRHVLTHHEPIACDICGITSPSLLQAENHKKLVHHKAKNKCPYCAIQSWGGPQYQRHVLKCVTFILPCKFCGKMFSRKTALSLHKKKCRARPEQNDDKNATEQRGLQNAENSSNMTEKVLLPQSGLSESKCYYCNEDFSSPGYLKHHLTTFHELTKCDICGITILGRSTRKCHVLICHTEPKFECSNCGKKFYQKGLYDNHWPKCEKKKYACDICGHRSKHLNIINRHKRLEHPDRVKEEETSICSQNDLAQPSKCSATRKGSSKNNLKVERKHQQTDHSLTSENDADDQDSRIATSNIRCKMSVDSQKTLQSPIEKPSVQEYRCSICKATSSEFSVIRQHMLTNHTDGKFQCYLCSKKIRTFRELEDHETVCADRKFTCEFCGHKFKYRWGVKKHINLLHRGIAKDTETTDEQNSNSVNEIEFEKSSDEKTALQPQGVNPSSESSNVKCPYCVKSFPKGTRLSRHLKRFHDPCACDICGLTFANGTKVKYHKRTCSQHSKEDDDFKSGSEDISLLHGKNSPSGSHVHDVMKIPTKSANMPHAANIELDMDIKVEDTMLVEEEQQGKSCTLTAVNTDQHKICKNPYGGKPKDAGAEDTAIAYEIKIKEECLDEDVEENLSGFPSGVPSNRSEFLMRHEAGAQVGPSYMTKIHNELLVNYPECGKSFDDSCFLQNPMNMHSKATKKNSRLKQQSSDDFDLSNPKKIKMEQ